MPASSVAVVNYALQLIDSQAQISALTDGSQEANAASVSYVPTVQLLLRQLDPDFARVTQALALSTGSVPPWTYEYTYPAAALRIRQVRPPSSGAGALTDPFERLPVLASVGYDPAVPAKVILTNQQNALAVYTTSSITELQWDSAFAEAVARRLGNVLAMAIAGRPDFARELLEESERYAGMAELVDESGDGQA